MLWRNIRFLKAKDWYTAFNPFERFFDMLMFQIVKRHDITNYFYDFVMSLKIRKLVRSAGTTTHC